ncbi:unnamed protein product [Toxocara canis]|uniref:Uncharacterized protein n=1 Tax=Toxocara canis TaxID=6265 RepID=A0A183TZZ3_TOXCA|nr:unnamed protein product [Toxocara canis]
MQLILMATGATRLTDEVETASEDAKRWRVAAKSSVSSGVAAGITIGVFFTVFLLTFGCRIYSARMERLERRNNVHVSNSVISAEDFMADLWICRVPREPPPPYEIAIHMPRCIALPPPPPPTP